MIEPHEASLVHPKESDDQKKLSKSPSKIASTLVCKCILIEACQIETCHAQIKQKNKAAGCNLDVMLGEITVR